MTATALWSAVVAAYDQQGLIELTNVREPEDDQIDTAIGESAAQHFIDLFPMYAEQDYDANDSQHVASGMQGTIAILWRRGGTSTEIEQVKWDTVFGQDGILSKLRNTTSRAHIEPVSSGPDLTSAGQEVRSWADSDAMPPGFLPSDSLADGDD